MKSDGKDLDFEVVVVVVVVVVVDLTVTNRSLQNSSSLKVCKQGLGALACPGDVLFE